ncbi:MAG: hypothetical protein K8R58_08655 [Bacteroidales bacterium]|nr:hypothetical protein [Bacteroidales bacterium]
MNYKNKSLFLWIFSIVFTLTIAYYQRITGPTYPVRDTIKIENKFVKFKLPRTHVSNYDAIIKIAIPDRSIKGIIKYKRLRSNDKWIINQMQREGEYLTATIPKQPPAGKIIYNVIIQKDNNTIMLTKNPVIIRFKGEVPFIFLIFHIIIMFFSLIFSTRTGLESVIKGKNTFKYTQITLILFFVGGIILGPIVQYYAFGDFWAGWPLGKDFTDNKTAIALIFWIIAFFRLLKNRQKTGWALIASIVLLLIYLIPHSIFGSELDYTSGEVITGQ